MEEGEEKEKGKVGSKEEHHDVVIVGGGICGLATALALHRIEVSHDLLSTTTDTKRKGINNLVLEKFDTLRALGAAIGVYINGWHALDQLGVGMELRRKAIPLTESYFANYIQDTRYVAPQEQDANNFMQVLIGCDGSNSVVAKSLGLQAPKIFPISVVRGFTSYSDGHSFDSHFIRLRDSDVQKDPVLIKKVTLEMLKEFPIEVIEMVKHCDSSSLSLTRIRYRAPWHLFFANFWQGTMTVAGDAMHVMGPFLGQGGSAGLEDAIVLARCVAQEMPMGPEGATSDREMVKRIGRALSKYVNERRLRMMRLSTQSYLTGSVMTASSWIKKLVCLAILIVFLRGGSLSHSNYNCGSL
ncbi:monooxygenase 1-like [Cocos nucifera]|nr:monooxygenase 1-like [Cocos nucifera]